MENRIDREKLIMAGLSIWLKLIIGISCFSIIMISVKYYIKDKVFISINNLPPENRRKILNSYSSIVKIYKFLIYAIPLNFILIPYIFYIYIPERFLFILVLLIMLYVLIVFDLILKRSMLKKFIDQGQ